MKATAAQYTTQGCAMYLSKSICQKILLIGGALLAIGAAVWLTLKLSFGILLPLPPALLAAAILRPIAEKLHHKLKFPFWLSSLLLTVLLYAALTAAICFAARKLVSEGTALLQNLLEKPDALFDGIENLPGKVFGGRLKLRADRLEWLVNATEETIGSMAEELSSGAAARIAAFAAKLPDLLLLAVTTVLATYYAIVGYPAIRTFFRTVMPKRMQKVLLSVKSSGIRYMKKVLTATGLLFILTFLLLLFGFWLLRFPYPFPPALLIALLDMLPVLGVGAALIPMALFYLLTGKHFVGIGLLILYAVIALLHQVLLPHLLGKENGTPPLITLVSMYAGYRLFGIWGLLLSPFAAMLAVSGYRLLRQGEGATHSWAEA